MKTEKDVAKIKEDTSLKDVIDIDIYCGENYGFWKFDPVLDESPFFDSPSRDILATPKPRGKKKDPFAHAIERESQRIKEEFLEELYSYRKKFKEKLLNLPRSILQSFKKSLLKWKFKKKHKFKPSIT
jgi:hypothetical protein